MGQFYDDDNADNLMKEITENLSAQIVQLDGSAEDAPQLQQDTEEDMPDGGKKKKKMRLGTKILVSVCSVIAVMVIGVVVSGAYFLNRINYEQPEDVMADHRVNDIETVDKKTEDKSDILPSDADVINVLLIGEEAIKDTKRGRSDSMMIATINQKQKSLKLTSIMRDCYVSIPGYRDNKLNAAYNEGGGPLLVQTIQQNFNIPLDGYVRVDFEGFESIIDELGGVEIELTESEAGYLNTHDYISNPSYRNVVPGKQTLNGNQALGYARVRYVKGIDGEHDDFGRTNRQRIVLNAVFEKYKSKNLVEYVSVANQLLPYITTDLTKTEILSYIASFVSVGSTKLETFRIPVDNTYTTAKLSGPGEVLMVNFEANNTALREFIYGAASKDAETQSNDTAMMPESAAAN